MFILRQGDVMIIAASNQTPGKEVPRDNGRVVLAYGEVTGHAHAIHAEGAQLLTIDGSEDRFLRIMNASGVALEHEEHSTIVLPPGDYLVRIQREYTSSDMPAIRVQD